MPTDPAWVAGFVGSATSECAAGIRRLVDVIDRSGLNLNAAVKQ